MLLLVFFGEWVGGWIQQFLVVHTFTPTLHNSVTDALTVPSLSAYTKVAVIIKLQKVTPIVVHTCRFIVG